MRGFLLGKSPPCTKGWTTSVKVCNQLAFLDLGGMVVEVEHHQFAMVLVFIPNVQVKRVFGGASKFLMWTPSLTVFPRTGQADNGSQNNRLRLIGDREPD